MPVFVEEHMSKELLTEHFQLNPLTILECLSIWSEIEY